MRALARFGRYAASVRRQIDEHYATGMSKTIQTGLTAQFKPFGMRPLERELALASFSFNGFYQAEDEVTVIPPDYRIGVFDSFEAQAENAWTEEERVMVEQELRRLAALDPNTLVIVPEVHLPAPWPRYDEFNGSIARLMDKIVDDGYILEDVLAYERENQDRPDVIAALEQLIEDGEVVQAEEVIG